MPLAGFLIFAGSLGDEFGRKKIFTSGLVIFTVSSLEAGLATSPTMLIEARSTQGLEAAMFTSTALAMIATFFEKEDAKERAISLYVSLGGAGTIAGLILGGMMTSFLGWRSVLLLNLPIRLVGAYISWQALGPKVEQRDEEKEERKSNSHF
jgi:MFS family permease